MCVSDAGNSHCCAHQGASSQLAAPAGRTSSHRATSGDIITPVHQSHASRLTVTDSRKHPAVHQQRLIQLTMIQSSLTCLSIKTQTANTEQDVIVQDKDKDNNNNIVINTNNTIINLIN